MERYARWPASVATFIEFIAVKFSKCTISILYLQQAIAVGEVESLQTILNEIQVLTDEERIAQVRITICKENYFTLITNRPLVLISRLILLNTEKQSSYFQKPLKILTRF